MWTILGIVAVLTGIVIMILGSAWGILAILAGFGIMAFRYTTMMHGRGNEPNQGTINGLAGQGKQQSEAVKVQMPEPGEVTSDIWEKMKQ